VQNKKRTAILLCLTYNPVTTVVVLFISRIVSIGNVGGAKHFISKEQDETGTRARMEA